MSVWLIFKITLNIPVCKIQECRPGGSHVCVTAYLIYRGRSCAGQAFVTVGVNHGVAAIAAGLIDRHFSRLSQASPHCLVLQDDDAMIISSNFNLS